VYVIDGLDPLGSAGLRSMTDRIRATGVEAQHSPWFKTRQIEQDIRAARRVNPGTPVVVIGYSLGAYRAKALVERLAREGEPVQMLGFVGGDYLRNQPTTAARVVNVRGDGFLVTGRNLFWNGTDIDGADNLRLSGVRHFDLPKREETFEALQRGIAAATYGASPTPAVASAGPAIPSPAAAAATSTARASATALRVNSSPAASSPAAAAAASSGRGDRSAGQVSRPWR
jgi:hypothetical protein